MTKQIVKSQAPKKMGRPKGSPNKVTLSAREALTKLIEANVPKMEGWLVAIEKEHGPLVAMKAVADMVEFAVPKLQRTELTGNDGGPLTITINKVA